MNVFWTTLRLTADLFMKLYWYSVYMIFTRFMRYFEDNVHQILWERLLFHCFKNVSGPLAPRRPPWWHLHQLSVGTGHYIW